MPQRLVEVANMGKIIQATEDRPAATPIRCPICAHGNVPGAQCRHVRWTFDQGDPMDFVRFAMETSPYTSARGFNLRDISQFWWDENIEWVVDQVMIHFEAIDGLVFGELAHLDLLARDIWKGFRPDPVRPQMMRVDPV
jgi:hypothetical protein